MRPAKSVDQKVRTAPIEPAISSSRSFSTKYLGVNKLKATPSQKRASRRD
jgi:hypothetical protein